LNSTEKINNINILQGDTYIEKTLICENNKMAGDVDEMIDTRHLIG